MMLPLTRLTLLLMVLLTPLTAAGREPVLHEYVPPPGEASRNLAPSGELPDFIRAEDRLLPRPEAGSSAPASGERVLGDGVRPDRSTSLQLDRSTGREGVLRYSATFNPSVVPFKRMTSLDRVEPGLGLGLRDSALRPEPLASGVTPPDRDAFWGSLLLSMQAGRAVPIPSVAAEARILSYQATPAARFSFFRDSADNFWVRSASSGSFRLVFLTDAPRHYFSPQIPPTVTSDDVPARLQPTLPAEAERAAATVLQRIEVRRGETLLRQLDRLIAYFRSFEPGQLPAQSQGNVYLDIALSQRGVCRHRSFAFVVTAQALGIPARYVHNEAHAFTEVFVPRLGWIRVDLGGASDELRVQNAEQKAVHHPGPDPFPRPSRYGSSYTQQTGRVTGLRASQRLPARPTGAVSLRSYDRSAGMIGPGTGSGAPLPAADSRRVVSADGGDEGEGEGEAGAPEPGKRLTEIQLFSPTRVAYRGAQVEVWGRVSSRGRGVGGLPIEIFLSRDGKTGEARLGTLVSGAEGRFRAALPVPRGVPVGDYQVFAATAGDARHQAALSR